MNRLLLKKMLVTFLAAFGGVFIPAVLDLLNKAASGTPTAFSKALIISLVAGAFSAGVRALIAFSPLNLVPTDSQHTIVGGK